MNADINKAIPPINNELVSVHRHYRRSIVDAILVLHPYFKKQ